MKKFLSFLLSAELLVTNIIPLTQFQVSATALNSTEVYGQGGIWSEIDASSDIPVQAKSSSIPSSFDITTNSNTARFFPPIGSQGNVNSCAGWASTYYQFTYEVNKFKNEATTADNIYSPSWTYNYINCNMNVATYLTDAYSVLQNQGAMLLKDYPYSSSLSSYSFEWSTDLDKMREALHYRATSYASSVSRNSLLSLDLIKSEISNGKAAVIWTNPDGWETLVYSGKYVVARSSYSEGGHFMTVVGYDDNFSVTINGQTLKGAFKLANSWGSSWGNNGYVWVLYDALLLQSFYGTAWQSGMTGVRTPVFGGASYNKDDNIYYYYDNQFSFIDIHECENYFVETLQFTSYEPWKLKLYGKNGSVPSTSNEYLKTPTIHIKLDNISPLDNASTRYLVFDYTNPDASFNVLNNLSTAWIMSACSDSFYSTYGIRSRLTDNLGNLIEPYAGTTGTIYNNQYDKVHYSNIAKGRVTAYDNHAITEADANLVIQYIARVVEFSSLQCCLADYNEDGDVDISDVIMMYGAIANANGRTFSLYDILPGMNYSIKDFIESQMDISYGDYISEHTDELESLNIIYNQDGLL